MTIPESIVAAVIQGVTEFLPISSSGHVTILGRFLGYSPPGVFYQIYLHFGSLLAVVFVFRRDVAGLFKQQKRLIPLIVVGSIPALIAGFFLKDKITPFFESAKLVGLFLMLNGIWLLVGHFSERAGRPERVITPWRALAIGVAQAAALFPGISRSGVTISCGLLLGMKRQDAYKFSFLLFIPVVLSVMFYGAGELDTLLANGVFSLAISVLVSFLVSIAALKLLLLALNKSRLYVFSVYCFIIGLLTVIML